MEYYVCIFMISPSPIDIICTGLLIDCGIIRHYELLLTRKLLWVKQHNTFRLGRRRTAAARCRVWFG
jgi:hypothetical protein